MKVEALTPVMTSAPGGDVTCRLRIENTEAAAARYRLRVVGFDDARVHRPPSNGPLAAGAAEEIDLRFSIPDAFAAGQHAVGVEVTADRPGARPSVVALTVAVGSIDKVVLAVTPSTMRGRRRSRFRVNIDNREREPVDVELDGDGPDLDVRLRPDRVRLPPGARVQVKGRVKGPRHLIGEPRQHALAVTARNRSSPTYASATFHQRSLFPQSLRAMLTILLVVAVWAGALGGGYWWWEQRGDSEVAQAELVDTDGDGIPDTPADELIDTDGDGVPDTPASEVAAQGPGGEASDDEAGDPDQRPASTVVGGTVKAGKSGDDSGVLVTLTPLELDDAAPEAEPAGLVSGRAWAASAPASSPERIGRHDQPGLSGVLQTTSVDAPEQAPAPETAASEIDGAWLFADVAIGQRYEVNFAKPGFNARSFVVDPPADGEPVELDVVLQPARGAVAGSVSGPAGPLGNVAIEVTDGTLTYSTTTGSGAEDTGAWSLSAISTPGTYTLTATLDGYGTEVVPITLAAGEQLDGVDISMSRGVGSIIGRVSSDGAPHGGVTITASNGDETFTTTSLTEGDTGTYSFPRLAVPGRYTLTASADGFVTQTRLVTLGGNVTGIDFVMVKTTATIMGTVVGDRSGPLPGATIELSRDDLTFDTGSAAAPDAGFFSVTDLPPGTYRVEFSRFDHRAKSQLVTVAAGEVKDLGEIVLRSGRDSSIDQSGSLTVRVVDSSGDDLTGATVHLVDVATGEVVATLPGPDDPPSDGEQATFVFEPVDVGTYLVEVERPPRYRDSTRRVSVGLRAEQVTIPLYLLGQASGRLVDSLTGTQLDDYEVVITRLNPDGTTTEVQRIVVPDGAPANDGPERNEIRWETEANTLTTGTYRIDVPDPPPGYRIASDQVVVRGQEPMQFQIDPDEDAPLDIADLEADIYPTLSGRVMAPRVDTSDGSVSLEPIDAADLRVRLSCEGGDPVPAPEVLDRVGLAGNDSYRYDPITLQEHDLSGACELRVSAGGYETTTVPLPRPLEPTDGQRSPDQVVDVDVRVFPTLTGTVRAPRVDTSDGSVSLEPIDSDDLSVALSCDGRPPVAAPELLDRTGGPGLDGYRFDRITIQDERLRGACTLTVRAAGYETARIDLSTPLEPTGPDVSPVKVVNANLNIYPTLTGTVRVPRLDRADDDVTFAPIDSDDLAVSLACGGRPPVAAPDLSDEEGASGLDRYRFDRFTIQDHDLTGVCTMTVRAPGYTTASFQLPRPLAPTDETTSPITSINVALVEPTDVGGTAYWIDRGTSPATHHPVAGATVRTQGDVIVGFDVGQGDGREPDPRMARADLVTATDADGNWVFLDPRQVFGTSGYVFDHDDDYDTRTIEVSISEDGRGVSAVSPPSGLELTNGDSTGVGVELDAHGGVVRGDITIHTIKGTPQFPDGVPNVDEFQMSISGADDHAADFVTGTPSNTGSATVVTDDPGTYRATIDEPDHHRLFGADDDTDIAVPFQEPGQDVSFERTYVELARIDVRLRDGLDQPLPVDAVTAAHTQGAEPGDPPTRSLTEPLDDAGIATFVDLPVNTNDPTGVGVDFRIGFDVPPELDGYDVAAAQATVVDELGNVTPCGSPTACDASVRAGGEQTVRFRVEQYGAITGNVAGAIPGADPSVEPIPLPVDSGLTVTARRVAVQGDSGVEWLPQPDPPITAAADPDDPDGFTFAGPAGYYTIEVVHDSYEAQDPPVVPPADVVLTDPVTQLPVPVFQMFNVVPGHETPNDIDEPWVLQTKRGRLEITAHQDTIDGIGVEGATVTVRGPNSFDPGDEPVAIGVTGPDGRFVASGLLPGDYQIAIESSGETHFPVIATVNVPIGTTDAARTRFVDAALARIGGAVIGDIAAINSESDLVPLPDELTITRTYHPSPVQVTGPDGTTPVPNEVTDDEVVTCPQGVPPPVDASGCAATPAPDQRYEYRFADLPVGMHELVFSDAPDDAYATPDPVTATAVLSEVTLDQVRYVAADRDVEVDVSAPQGADGEFTVALVPPDGDPDISPTIDDETYTFTDVPPELDPYTLRVTGPLYAPFSRDVTVSPGPPDDVVVLDPVVLTGSRARVTGSVLKQPPTPPTGLDGAAVELLTGPDDAPVVVQSAVTDPSGGYVFELDLEQPGAYRVRASRDGYAVKESASFDLAPGDIVEAPDVVLPAAATFDITVNGPPAASIDVVIVRPASQAGTEGARVGRRFSFALDPDDRYQFQASAPGYVTERVPSNGTIPVDPGEHVTRSVTLDERLVSGVVSPEEAGIRVVATNGALTLETVTDDDGEFELEGVDAGDWTFVAEELGVGRGVAAETIDDLDGDRDVDIDVEPRSVPIEFPAMPAGAVIELRDEDDDLIMSGTVGEDAFAASEDEFPVSWDAELDGYEDNDGTVPLEVDGDTFDLEVLPAIVVDATLTPEPTPTTVPPPTSTTPTTSTPATTLPDETTPPVPTG